MSYPALQVALSNAKNVDCGAGEVKVPSSADSRYDSRTSKVYLLALYSELE